MATLQTFGSGTLAVNLPISDAAAVSRTTSVNMSAAKPLEEVVIALHKTHSYRSDLQAYLTSPSGTTGRLVWSGANDGEDDFNWSFTSNAFRGESSNGTWTVRVADNGEGDNGTWKTWALNLRTGDLVPALC